MKKIQDCHISKVNHLNEDTFIIEMEMPEIPEDVKSGMFAEIRVDHHKEVFLRRPLSIYSVDYSKKTIGFFIKYSRSV